MSESLYSAKLTPTIFRSQECAGSCGGEFTKYPQLQRLCDDFGLHISRPARRHSQPSAPESFGLVEQHPEKERCLTPFFPSLSQLEAFVADNLVDILHDYFFGEQEVELA